MEILTKRPPFSELERLQKKRKNGLPLNREESARLCDLEAKQALDDQRVNAWCAFLGLSPLPKR